MSQSLLLGPFASTCAEDARGARSGERTSSRISANSGGDESGLFRGEHWRGLLKGRPRSAGRRSSSEAGQKLARFASSHLLGVVRGALTRIRTVLSAGIPVVCELPFVLLDMRGFLGVRW